jgi:hypothetical protein
MHVHCATVACTKIISIAYVIHATSRAGTILKIWEGEMKKQIQCPACGHHDVVLRLVSACNVCHEDIILEDKEMKDEMNPCWTCGKMPAYFPGEYGCAEEICCTNLKCSNKCSSASVEDWNSKKDSSVIYVDIDRKELERLKRLDKNVKKNIKMLDEVFAKLEECYSVHNLDDNDDYNEISNQKKLLKSLYDEEQERHRP